MIVHVLLRFPAPPRAERHHNFLLRQEWAALPSAKDFVIVETFWHFRVAADPRRFLARSADLYAIPDQVVEVRVDIDEAACRAFDKGGIMDRCTWTADEFEAVWRRLTAGAPHA